MVTLEETVKFCKKWFEENNKPIPKTARAWLESRVGKGEIPPGHSYAAIRRKGISPGDVLEGLLATYHNRVKSERNDISFLSYLGLEFISNLGEEITYKCLGCKEERTTLKGTLRRWESKQLKYCSLCRSAPGLSKSIDYYRSKFKNTEFSIIEVLDGRTLKLVHNSCGTEVTRGTQHTITSEYLCCPTCDGGASNYIFTSGMSKQERLAKEKVVDYCDKLGIEYEFEVLYKTFCDTKRAYRLDVYFPEYRTGLEITTKGNKLPNYHSNLAEKIEVAKNNNINIIIVTEIAKIKDIVQSLPKGKEA